MTSFRLPLLALAALLCYPAVALDRPGTTFIVAPTPDRNPSITAAPPGGAPAFRSKLGFPLVPAET